MLKFNNKVMKFGNYWGTSSSVIPPEPDPYNPLDLPANTIRVKFKSDYTPDMGDTQTLVDAENNVWDIYKASNDWYRLFYTNDSLLEVLGANTANVTNMVATFQSCYSMTAISLFNTSSVTSMSYMFTHCRSMTSVPLFDTSNVTSMDWMFYYCTSLSSVPLFNTSNVTNMTHMFTNCGQFRNVPLFDTSKVTDMSGMFADCNFTSIPLFNTSNVTNMGSMFSNCGLLASIPLFNTSNVTNMDSMFYKCTRVQSGALALYQQASSQTTPPSSHDYTFTKCGSYTTTGTAELAQIPSSWGGTGT